MAQSEPEGPGGGPGGGVAGQGGVGSQRGGGHRLSFTRRPGEGGGVLWGSRCARVAGYSGQAGEEVLLLPRASRRSAPHPPCQEEGAGLSRER